MFVYELSGSFVSFSSLRQSEKMLQIFVFRSYTVKPLNSGHLRVLKNLSVIERCPLLGGNFPLFKAFPLFGITAIGRFHRIKIS